MKFGPTALRVRRTISTAIRLRFSGVPPPHVGALVGALAQELVDEVALTAHDLDAVVVRLLREPGAADEVADLPAHAAAGEFAGAGTG